MGPLVRCSWVGPKNIIQFPPNHFGVLRSKSSKTEVWHGIEQTTNRPNGYSRFPRCQFDALLSFIYTPFQRGPGDGDESGQSCLLVCMFSCIQEAFLILCRKLGSSAISYRNQVSPIFRQTRNTSLMFRCLLLLATWKHIYILDWHSVASFIAVEQVHCWLHYSASY